MAEFALAFLDCELEEIQEVSDAVDESLEHVNAIETTVTEQVGAENAASLSSLVEVLESAQRFLHRQLERRGVTKAAEGSAEEEAESATSADDGAAAGEASRRLSGEVETREDVIRAIDKICDYYDRHEPSSPLPLLLRRAQRLAGRQVRQVIGIGSLRSGDKYVARPVGIIELAIERHQIGIGTDILDENRIAAQARAVVPSVA